MHNQTNTLIDWSALQNRFNGRQAFIEKLILQTLEGAHQGNVYKLRQAASEQDNATVKFIAHNVKSLAGFFEAQSLFEIAQETDHAVCNQLETTPILAMQLADTMQQFLEELKQNHDIINNSKA